MSFYYQISAIYLNTFQTLRRDRIFIPAFLFGLGMVFIAIIASDWGFENIRQILFDIGSFGFHLSGSFVALFWGTQLISKANQDGSSQMQLIAPIPRSLWILGNYIGLIATLTLFSFLLIILWQTTIWIYADWFLTQKNIIVLFFHTLSWWVLAAVAICFASITSHNTALFSTICLWFIGLMVPTFAEGLQPESPAISRFVLSNLSYLWNLQIFHIDPLEAALHFKQIFWKTVYAIALIASLLSISILSFKQKDLGRNNNL